jgi:hypothetical protein
MPPAPSKTRWMVTRRAGPVPDRPQRVLDGPAERAVRAGILRLLAQQRGVAWLGATTDRGIGGRG